MTGWILSSSVLIIIIISLRFFLKGKLAPGLQYGLWLLVLLRLLIPGELISSPFSVQHLLTTEAATHHPSASVSYEYYEFQRNTAMYTYNIPEYSASQTEPPIEEEYKTAAPTVEVQTILKWVWGAGAFLMILVFLLSNLQFHFKLLRSRKRLDIHHGLPVFTSKGLPSPCLFGVLHPAVYIPEDCSRDETVVAHILAHETAHYRHGDHLWSLLRSVAVAFHWYNPLVWAAAILSKQDAELACDAAAIRKLGEPQRIAYGQTLLHLIISKPRPADLLSCATTMNASKRSLRFRIQNIVKQPKMLVTTLICVLLISIIAVGCTFTDAKTTETDEIEETDALVSDGVTMFHHYVDALVYLGNDKADELVDLYNNQQMRKTGQPMDTLDRITVIFNQENASDVFWSTSPHEVCAATDVGNYVWENNQYEAIADIFWEHLYIEGLFVMPTNLSNYGARLPLEDAAIWIEIFRGMELTPTSNEPDSISELTVMLELDLAGDEPVKLFSIDEKGEVTLYENDGSANYFMCNGGEAIYERLKIAYDIAVSVPPERALANTMVSQAAKNFEATYQVPIKHSEIITFCELESSIPDTKVFFTTYRIKPKHPDASIPDGMEVLDGWIMNGDSGPLYLIYQKKDGTYEFFGTIFETILDQEYQGDLALAAQNVIENAQNQAAPHQYIHYDSSENKLVIEDSEFWDDWLVEFTAIFKNGDAYYEILSNQNISDYNLNAFEQASVTITCQNPDNASYGDIYIMAFPALEEDLSATKLSQHECLEILRAQLIEAYETRFETPYEPLDKVPVADFSEQNVMRYQIANLQISRAVGRFYTALFNWNFFVDFYTGEVYLHYNGLDQTFVRFDPSSPYALSFAG